MAIDKIKHKKNSILLTGLLFVCMVAAFLIAQSAYAAASDASAEQYTEQDLQMANDAGFVKGFEYMSTTALVVYCSPTGYIPNTYINKFNSTFKKTIANANSILAKYVTKEQMQTEIIDKIHPACISSMDEIYTEFHSQYGISKKQFCQLFDAGADDMISDKIQILKQQRPHMYKD